eukprot:352122-Chlamydomonas_euryale.AAC.6
MEGATFCRLLWRCHLVNTATRHRRLNQLLVVWTHNSAPRLAPTSARPDLGKPPCEAPVLN